MANNFDKIVKLACKPKRGAIPKAKYVDALVAATYSDDGSVQDIIRSLSLRVREPNSVVVFKALLTLHQMIRSGSTDQLLEQLSKSDVLRLRNVSGQNWEGYTPPSSLGAYARYLDARIASYKHLKHDLVRAQTESNRRSDGQGAAAKARRLRHLPVDKGLLREVKAVQRILDALVQCKFYDDDLKDENTVLAFRMLVKDLLVLFQGGNEGVCNILEHYFEMSKLDATESFDIYKSFISQTDRVVDYLGVARKLHNVVNVPVPNLKHAPTSLVKALEEYLNDPNFEQNRREYRNSLGVLEGKGGARTPSPIPAISAPKEESKPAPAPTGTLFTSGTSAAAAPPAPSQRFQDFFDSIQADQQPTMFGGPAQQINYQQEQAFNPFRQSMVMPQQTGFMGNQMTGFPGAAPLPQQPFFQPQPTGQPFGQNPFPTQQGQQGQQPFLPPQQTGFMQPQPQHSQATGFLQPQTTGSNPFRQSTMLSLNTSQPSGAFSQPTSPFGQAPNPSFASMQRPGSVPAAASPTKPLIAQSTGSKNPFAPAGGVPQKPQSPLNKGPTMNELAFGAFYSSQQQQQPASTSPWNNGPSAGSATLNGKPSDPTGISDIASSFAFESKPSSGQTNNNDFLSQFGSLSVATDPSTLNSNTSTSPSPFSQFGTFSNSTATSPISSPGGFLQPQQTGFGGSTIKPFKPTSSFGSQLMAGLPEGGATPSSSGPTSPIGGAGTGGVQSQSQSTGFPGMTMQQTGATGGLAQFGGMGMGMGNSPFNPGGLQAQSTGQPNPFRSSTLPLSGGVGGGGGAFGAASPFAGQNQNKAPQGQNPSPFGSYGAFGGGGSNQGGSLI